MLLALFSSVYGPADNLFPLKKKGFLCTVIFSLILDFVTLYCYNQSDIGNSQYITLIEKTNNIQDPNLNTLLKNAMQDKKITQWERQYLDHEITKYEKDLYLKDSEKKVDDFKSQY